MATSIDFDDLKARNRPTKVESLPDAVSVFARHSSPWIIASVMVMAWTTKIVLGGWSWADLLFGSAILILWPVQEWLIHVFILHFKPRTIMGRKIDLHAAHMHRIHHRVPWVLEYVFVPTRTVLQVVFVGMPLFLLGWWATGLPMSIAVTGVAVFSTFGLVYEWTHFIVHTNRRPSSDLYKGIWNNHPLAPLQERELLVWRV